LVVAITALLVVLERENINPGLAGMALTYALSLTNILNMMVRVFSEIENQLVAVERIVEYSNLPTEGPYEVPHKKPDGNWPREGRIVIRDLKMRYRDNLDLVLKGVSAEIKPKEKVGVVGRTGAGKSSIMLALFRFVEPVEGTILIDDVDIREIGLSDLRSVLAIIPQDPILFTGTIRSNLDPTEVHTDHDIWGALEAVYMKETVQKLPSGLSNPVVENGENLSVGQRQLMCLGRALLRGTKILLMDEATASVDLETDALIQRTIREKFKNVTVITIAHRLNTILDSDRIIVMDHGKIVEFDTPQALEYNESSLFHAMLEDHKNGV